MIRFYLFGFESGIIIQKSDKGGVGMRWIVKPEKVSDIVPKGCAIYVHPCGNKIYVEF